MLSLVGKGEDKIPKKSICEGCKKVCYAKNTENPMCRVCSTESRRKKQKYNRKDYAKNWTYIKKYNLTLEEFDLLWIVFKGKCSICEKNLKNTTPTKGQSLDSAVIDHDHKTGNIRGLLCGACNRGLGLFKDDISILEKAKEYLK